MNIKCEKCNEDITVDQDAGGASVECPACSASQEVPQELKNKTVKVKKSTRKFSKTGSRSMRAADLQPQKGGFAKKLVAIIIWVVLVGVSVTGLAYYIKPVPEKEVKPVVDNGADKLEIENKATVEHEKLAKEFETIEAMATDNSQQLEQQLQRFTELFKKAVLVNDFKISGLALDKIEQIQARNVAVIKAEIDEIRSKLNVALESGSFAEAAGFVERLQRLGVPKAELAQYRQKMKGDQLQKNSKDISGKVAEFLAEKEFDKAVNYIEEQKDETDLAAMKQYCNELIHDVCLQKNKFYGKLRVLSKEVAQYAFAKKYKSAAKLLIEFKKNEADKAARDYANELYKQLKSYVSFDKKLVNYLMVNQGKSLNVAGNRSIKIKKIELNGSIKYVDDKSKKRTWKSVKSIPVKDYLTLAEQIRSGDNAFLKAMLCVKRNKAGKARDCLEQMPYKMGEVFTEQLKQVVMDKTFVKILRKYNLINSMSTYSTEKAADSFKNVTLNKKAAAAVISEVNAFLRKYNDVDFMNRANPLFDKINHACRKSGQTVQLSF